MAKNMTPSATDSKKMTERQINKVVANYRAVLEGGASNFDSDVVQAVLGDPTLTDEMFSLFRKRVESRSKEIVRRVKVDRTIEPQAMLDALGRNQHANNRVVATMPRGEGEEVDVNFFQLESEEYTRPGYISDDDLARAFDRRGYKPDPYAQAQANKDDPGFADERPNGTHWKDGDHYNYAAFGRWDDKREVHVYRSGSGWGVVWWFAGVRK